MKSRWMHRLAGAIVIVLLLVLILGYASAIVLVRGMFNHRVVRNAHTLAETGLPRNTVEFDVVEGPGHMVFVGGGGGPEDEPYRDAILTFLSGIH